MKENNDNKTKYLSQKELSQRWVMSQGTLINMRKRGELQFFIPPSSNRVLYLLKDVLRIEEEGLSTIKTKEVTNSHTRTNKVKNPINPTDKISEWRI